MLERVQARVAQRGFVKRGQVPDVEVDRPQRERDGGVREHAQAIYEAGAQHGREQRAGESEHEQ